MCKSCSKLTIKTPEQRQCRCSGVPIVNFEQLLHNGVGVSIDDIEQVNVGY